ncbi:MAG: tRNA (adenosine(37)-N6)-threonylcarbamoyltransferase complex ATPase subunit type 1 TsaE [Bacteroidia bacterium]|nr:tRNA (adenosine(37)-N6)-threonylcarbamoyltransferase complex ATPase subunit type 1 TsaE [Bacteroidia bacterium]
MVSKQLKISVNSLTELPVAANKIVEIIGDETIIAFYGEMGAGKTTLIKEICRILGSNDTVTSPTFSLMNEYKTKSRRKIFHFDFYRIQSIAEAYDMGYEDFFFSQNLCLIEWPEKIKQLLPENCLRINIIVENNLRTITVLK